MELKEGMYVRTKKGNIGKITFISPLDGLMNLDTENYSIGEHFIIKSSYNIIDLIEVGDYVNGYKIYSGGKKQFDYILTWDDVENYYMKIPLLSVDIKSIVTKEQFESMQYEIN